MEKRKKRTFTPEFKAEAVRLVVEEQQTVSQVARDLDLTASALRTWVLRSKADQGVGPAGAVTSDERAELQRLRKENRVLKMEREILKKAAAFFAKENP
jgi:transposase